MADLYRYRLTPSTRSVCFDALGMDCSRDCHGLAPISNLISFYVRDPFQHHLHSTFDALTLHSCPRQPAHRFQKHRDKNMEIK